MTPQDVLAQLQAYRAAGSYADWQQKVAPQAIQSLTASAATTEAAMVASYLNLLPGDIAADAYGSSGAAVANNVAAVVDNLALMLNPPPTQ